MRLTDTVSLNFPVKKALNTAQSTFAQTIDHFAASLNFNRVWIYRIYQTNNKVDVIGNLSVKVTHAPEIWELLLRETFPKYSTTPPADILFLKMLDYSTYIFYQHWLALKTYSISHVNGYKELSNWQLIYIIQNMQK